MKRRGLIQRKSFLFFPLKRVGFKPQFIGKKEEYKFPGIYGDKKILFDTERLDGYAWEVDDSTIILWITYKGMPDFYIYEMINISPDNNHHARTWHWFNNHQIVKRTIIKEERVS